MKEVRVLVKFGPIKVDFRSEPNSLGVCLYPSAEAEFWKVAKLFTYLELEGHSIIRLATEQVFVKKELVSFLTRKAVQLKNYPQREDKSCCCSENKMVFPKVLKVTILRESGEKENFLLSIGRYIQVCHKFDNLKNEIVARYPELLQYEEIRFAWIDDEGDEIIILNHVDYYDYMDACTGPIQKRRIYVRGIKKIEQPQQQQQPKPSERQEAPMEQESVHRQEAVPTEDLPVHTNVLCDVCDDMIHGHRYKCMQCFNYDLCMRCESRFRHKDHMMVRIPTPELNTRAPFRLFEKLRNFAADLGAQPGFAAASDAREDDYENSKRSKRHHRRHSRDRDDSKECREEKERKERKQRRERCAKSSEERRGGHRHRFGHGFNFSHLINQVIDPANIQSAFISADAAAAAAAAAAESAEEAVRASMVNCPMFASMTMSNSATTSASASASATASTSAPTQQPGTESASTATSGDAPQQEASAPSPVNEEPQAKKATTSSAASPGSPKQMDMIDLSWLAPTPESIQKINQTFSKILDPLGMNIEIRSNSAAPKPAQTQTPTEEKKDKTTETANTPTTSTPSQTPPGGAGTSSKATEMDPIVELEKKLEAVLMAEPQLQKKIGKMNDTLTTSDDDDCSSVSSVSLLSDNDDSIGGGGRSEKRWTLVDIPGDVEEPTPKSTESVKIAAEVNSPKQEEPVASTSYTPATPAATAVGSYPEAGSASSTNNGITSKPIDYEQLGMALKQHLEAEQQAALDKALKQHFEAEQQAAATTKVTSSPSPQASAPKEASPAPIPAVVVPAVHATPVVHTVYSHKPHVNHAVHAMMAMGFSNEGAWLTQLLDSVNGDIPRALDHLTPHKINP